MDFIITILNIFINTFNWKGKATRSDFNSYIYFILIVVFILSYLTITKFQDLDDQTFDHIINITGAILYLPFICLSIRRLRDMGRPIWLHLLYYIPFIGIYILYLQCTEPSKSSSFL